MLEGTKYVDSSGGIGAGLAIDGIVAVHSQLGSTRYYYSDSGLSKERLFSYPSSLLFTREHRATVEQEGKQISG